MFVKSILISIVLNNALGWQVEEYSDSEKQLPQLPALPSHFFTPIDFNNETSGNVKFVAYFHRVR